MYRVGPLAHEVVAKLGGADGRGVLAQPNSRSSAPLPSGPSRRSRRMQ